MQRHAREVLGEVKNTFPDKDKQTTQTQDAILENISAEAKTLKLKHQQKLLSLNMLFFFNVFQHAIFFFNMLFFISTCYFFPASFSTCYFLQVHFSTCYFMFSTCYFFLHQFQHAIFSTCYFCTWLFNMLNSAKPYLNMLFFISIAMLAWWTPHGEWVLTTWEDGLVPSI